MICVDCKQSIPGFEAYPDIEDVCDKCLMLRYQNNPKIKKHLPEGKAINELSYEEASYILDSVGMIDFPLESSVRDVIVIGDTNEEATN